MLHCLQACGPWSRLLFGPRPILLLAARSDVHLLPESIVANVQVGAALGNSENFDLALALGCLAFLGRRAMKRKTLALGIPSDHQIS